MNRGMLIVDSDNMLEEVDFEFYMDRITEVMHKKNKWDFWKVSSESMTWRKLKGEKYFRAEDGATMLWAVLPKTDNRFQVFKESNGFVIVCYHHDAPTGETYWVRRCSERTYNRNVGEV